MEEIVFDVKRDEESSFFIASWDVAEGDGGITTQGHDLSELQAMARESVLCHFDKGNLPKRIRLRWVNSL